MAQELKMNQRLTQRLTQQQLRFVRLLELNAPELDEAVERELEANPALEVADAEQERERREADSTPYYLRHTRNSGADSDTYDFTPEDDSESLYDVLNREIDERHLSEDVKWMARYIVGNLDSNGYLRRDLAGMLNDVAFGMGHEVSESVGVEALDVVRSLSPAGVGAENLRDCLLLQLRRLPESEERNDALHIIEDQFEAFSMRHSHKIVSALRMSKSRIDAANELILTLNPKPGASYGGASSTAAGVIVPDFVVSREGGELYISLNNRIPDLAIEESFSEAMRGMERRRGRPRKGTEFINTSYNDARDFINILHQRQQTMMSVMSAIVSLQREYFETGDVYTLRPMMLKDISRVTGLDPSVISRASGNKYVSMPWGGVMSLRSFFSDTVAPRLGQRVEMDSDGMKEASPSGSMPGEEIAQNGEDVLTNRKIEATISKLIDEEDKRHPLSDEKLRLELVKLGYDISRRTIAKYRDRQGILVARLRKEL